MFDRKRLSTLVLIALASISVDANAQDKCGAQVDQISDTNLKTRLSKLQTREDCLRTQTALASFDSKSEESKEDFVAVDSKRKQDLKEAEDAAADVKSKIDFKQDFGLGVGLGFSWGSGPERVDQAEVVNGVVRIKKTTTDKPRLFLEAHKFFMSFSDGDLGMGPFVSLQSGADDALSSWGLGWMIGFRDTVEAGEPTRSWNLGVGYLWDADAQILGEGIVANQPLPAGETEIRYTNKSLGSLFVMFSRKF